MLRRLIAGGMNSWQIGGRDCQNSIGTRIALKEGLSNNRVIPSPEWSGVVCVAEDLQLSDGRSQMVLLASMQVPASRTRRSDKSLSRPGNQSVV